MKIGIVLMNLGTPQEPTAQSVKAFLREFLSDKRVVEIPRFIWWFVLNLIILTFRTPKVVRAYKKIWTAEGSPLRVITLSQVKKLQQLLDQKGHDQTALIVRHAMAYSGPSLGNQVKQLVGEGAQHIIVLPLYPQYSATTTGSIYDQVAKLTLASRDVPSIYVVKHYYDSSMYIEALAQSCREQWEKTGKPERLLMSFHSIPQKYSDSGDPYFFQCQSTATRLAQALNLNDNEWALSFQSRLGYSKWLSPYTSETLIEWGREKVGHINVICPAFSVDCLETLEEIQIENRELFKTSGGGDFQVVPCLNDSDIHIELMSQIIQNNLPKSD